MKFMKESYHTKEHKQLTKDIMSCRNCCPAKATDKYCNNCINTFITFCNKFGIGTITQDLKIYDLQKQNNKLESENKSLQQQLDNKNRKYEELKSKNSEVKDGN